MFCRALYISVICTAAAAAVARGDIAPSVAAQADGTPRPTTAATAAAKSPADAFPIDGFPPGDAAAGAGLTPGAQDAPELELFKDIPIVVAAGKREQTLSQAPASASVVTDDDILLFGYRNLADVLRGQRSFYLHTDGLNRFAGTRGFLRPGEWNARLLMLVDGRPTREVIYGQTHLDQDFVVPVEAIKRVEIIRGPGSALYGSNAVFGVINVVTKDGADVNGLEVKVTGGTQQTARADVLYGTTFKGWDVVADFSGYTSEGDRHIHYDGVHDPALNGGNINGFDYEGVYAGFLKARRGEFTVTVDFANRDKDNRAATYLTSFTDPGTMKENRVNVTARVDHEIDDAQSLHAMVHYGHYGYRQDLPYADDGNGNPYDYVTEAHEDWLDEEVHYDWQATKRFHVLVGAEGTQSLYARQHDFDSLQGSVLNVPASYNTAAVFAEGEMKFTDWLSVTVGGRYDQVQRLGGNGSPRFAAVVTPNETDTFKALYGRAFREPNLYELLYSAPGQNTPNPDLKAEVVDTYELVWEHAFKSGWRTTLDGYWWNMSDAMDNVQRSDGSIQTRNVGQTTARGVEAEVAKRWETDASFRAYATYTWADMNGVLPTQSPKWIVGTSLAMPVYKRDTFIAVEPQIVGPMKSDLGRFTDPTFATNVVFTTRDLVKGWTLQAGVYNLFADEARFPRDGAFNQVEPTLNYPKTQFLVSASHKF